MVRAMYGHAATIHRRATPLAFLPRGSAISFYPVAESAIAPAARSLVPDNNACREHCERYVTTDRAETTEPTYGGYRLSILFNVGRARLRQ